MTTETTPKTPLDGLLMCGMCGAPLRYEEPNGAHEARYFCNRAHPAGTQVALQAQGTDQQVISGVMTAMLTGESAGALLSAITEPEGQENDGSDFPADDVGLLDIGLLKENIAVFLADAGRAERTRNFLAGFITRIDLFPDRAVVRYAMPLPSGSHLAGATEQELPLSADGVH